MHTQTHKKSWVGDMMVKTGMMASCCVCGAIIVLVINTAYPMIFLTFLQLCLELPHMHTHLHGKCYLSTENGHLQVQNKQHCWRWYNIFIRWKMAMSVVLAYNKSIIIFSLYNMTSGVQMLVCTVIDKSCVFTAHLCNLYCIRNLLHCQSASKGQYKVNHTTNSPNTGIQQSFGGMTASNQFHSSQTIS